MFTLSIIAHERARTGHVPFLAELMVDMNLNPIAFLPGEPNRMAQR